MRGVSIRVLTPLIYMVYLLINAHALRECGSLRSGPRHIRCRR